MAALGQSEKIILEKVPLTHNQAKTIISEDTEMEGSFMLSRVKRLQKESDPCTEDTSRSFTSCVKVLLLKIKMDFHTTNNN